MYEQIIRQQPSEGMQVSELFFPVSQQGAQNHCHKCQGYQSLSLCRSISCVFIWGIDGSAIQNGSICAMPRRMGRTQLRATKLSEGPYIETETYPAPKDLWVWEWEGVVKLG